MRYAYQTSSSGTLQRIGHRTRQVATERYIDACLAQAEAAAVINDD